MREIKCKNDYFEVTWYFHKQRYEIYYKGKFFGTAYNFRDVVSYTN